ncbi:MAG: ABC transporter permease [Anaerolineae bacterium]
MSQQPFITIDANAPKSQVDLRELWHYRELLWYLSWREISIRYKQTILGILWAVLQPFTTMVVFTIFFGNVAQIATNGIPYPIFSFAGLVPWTFFSGSLTSVTVSLTTNANLLKKIYFPRLILPISRVISGLIDFGVAFVILIVMTLGYIVFGAGIPDAVGEVAVLQLTLNVLWLPYFLIIAFMAALGFGLWLAPLNVQFRDIRYLSPVLIRLWLFISPVIYPLDLIDSRWQFLYSLNPMVAVLDGFRWALLGVGSFPVESTLIGTVTSLIVLVTGMIFFSHVQNSFADVV